MIRKWLGLSPKKDENTKSQTPLKRVEMNLVEYDLKILIAWAKAIEGNHQLNEWLYKNGYTELSMAVHAIYLKNEARDWLMKNGYPHLMAFIHAAEGNAGAQKWLLFNGMELYYHMAMAVEAEENSWTWLRQNATEVHFLLAQSIKKIKDKIEENHNDIHLFGRDM
jgi:hypothetical protein